jgi:hypothetical protein
LLKLVQLGLLLWVFLINKLHAPFNRFIYLLNKHFGIYSLLELTPVVFDELVFFRSDLVLDVNIFIVDETREIISHLATSGTIKSHIFTCPLAD